MRTAHKSQIKTLTWMSGALLSFCLMAIGARELSGELSIFQTLFFRSAMGLVLVSLILYFKKQTHLIHSRRIATHTFRNIFHFAGQYGWFLGIGLLPLADVFALEFTGPIWTAIIASLFLGENITRRKIISIALGILGVLIIVKPGYTIIDYASLIVLAAAICFSISYVTTKSLSSSEEPLTILFYMSLVQLPVGLFFSLFAWNWPKDLQWLWLVLIGLTALSAHYCLAKAMQFAEVTTIVTVDFIRLPLIALIGVLLYQEEFELSLLLGGAVMLTGNLINLSQRSPIPTTLPK